MFEFLKEFYRDIRRKVRIKKVVRLSDADFIPSKDDSERIKGLKRKIKALEESRGYAEADKAVEVVKRKKLENIIKGTKKVNISKLLSDRIEYLDKKRISGGFSTKKFFLKIGKHFGGKKVGVYSYNYKKRFGTFHDLGFLPDGRIAIFIKTKNGRVMPIITGKTLKDIFRNFSGLSHIANKGFIAINLDENGNYVENIEAREVPDVIVDAHGNIGITKYDQDMFINRLAEKGRYINKLFSELKAFEKIIGHQVAESQIKELGETLSQARAESTESELKKLVESIVGVLKSYRQLEIEKTDVATGKKLAEEKARRLELAKSDILDLINKHWTKEDKERIMSEVKEFFEWTLDQIKKGTKSKIVEPSLQRPPPIITTPTGKKVV